MLTIILYEIVNINQNKNYKICLDFKPQSQFIKQLKG